MSPQRIERIAVKTAALQAEMAELEIVARFPDDTMTITDFADLEEPRG